MGFVDTTESWQLHPLHRSPMLLVLLLLLSTATGVVNSSPSFTKIKLPSNTTGPVTLAFDPLGYGPYVGSSDGRVLKYEGPTRGFGDFAYTSAHRSKRRCGGKVAAPDSASICGRPLGLGFNSVTKELYITDAFLGLHVAPASGGPAKLLSTGAEGVRFRFLHDVVVDQTTGIVYFTDYSSVFNMSQLVLAFATKDKTGRLLSYNPSTKAVSVLLNGLEAAGGVAVSADGSFLLTESYANRIWKYWLKGPSANTSEILVPYIPLPDYIKRTSNGEYLLSSNVLTPLPLPSAVRINSYGTILESTPMVKELGFSLISEVQEFRNSRYVGSVVTDFIGVYSDS